MKLNEKQSQAVSNLRLAILRCQQEGMQAFEIVAAINSACGDLPLPTGTAIAVTVTTK